MNKKKRKYVKSGKYAQSNLAEADRLKRIAQRLDTYIGDRLVAEVRALAPKDFEAVLNSYPVLAKKVRDTVREANQPTASSLLKQVNDLTSILAKERSEHNEALNRIGERVIAGGKEWGEKLQQQVEQHAKTRWELAKAAMLVDLLSDEVCHLKEDLQKK